MLKNIFALSFLLLATTFGTTAAMAGTPNLEVMAWQGNATPLVESPYQYTTRVRNIGNGSAQSVTIVVEFPLTNTSPNKYILGKLTGVSASSGTCSTAGNKITCNVGSLGNNQTKSVTFTFEFQVATTAPTFKTTASAGTQPENNPNNNIRATTPAIRYPDNVIGSGTYIVSSCTGRGLTSFYECELFPSSIQTGLSLDFNLGGTLGVTGYPMYTGLWDQNSLTNKSLHFTVDGELEFNGFASNGACFKGITTFVGNTTYNSAYRVCEL
ncbi:MAG: hypothetical protein ABL952_17265 [Pyrinomonadaceae bacterium]|nr:hypothetical protein [Pyrinomonadaceae bacterium]